MKIAYYPGCSATGSSADYEKSTQAVCAALGMQMEEIYGWSCCGSTPAHSVDTQLSGALSARNLDLAARQKADMVLTPCPSCLSNLRHAAKRLENPEFRAGVNELLDEPLSENLPCNTSSLSRIISPCPPCAAPHLSAAISKSSIALRNARPERTFIITGVCEYFFVAPLNSVL